MLKVCLTFEKSGNMRFIGHLDMMRAFQRAVARSKLPIAYSQGFNPHQLIGFALPLPVGYTGLNELCEMTLDVDTLNELCKTPPALDVSEGQANDYLAGLLNPLLPPGLWIKQVEELPQNAKSAAARVFAAEFEIVFPEPMQVDKEAANGVALKLNATDSVNGLCGGVVIEIPHGSAKNVKPEHVLALLLGCEPEPFQKQGFAFTRRRLILKQEQGKL